MEGLAVLVNHNCVRVSVANAQYEGCRTVACAGVGDCVNGLVHLVLVLVLDPLEFKLVYVSLRKHCVLLRLLPLLDGAVGKAKLGRPGQGQTLLKGHTVSIEDKIISRCKFFMNNFRRSMLADLGTAEKVITSLNWLFHHCSSLSLQSLYDSMLIRVAV